MQQAIRKSNVLRLVKPIKPVRDQVMVDSKKTTIGSEEYYKQVEHYAQKIRRTSDVDEIIGILDVVLAETRGLHLADEVHTAQAQVQHAEQKIELLKDELAQLRELVHADQMTGAFNRRGLNEIFMREAARADRSDTPLCVALLDIDNFKQINDTYGHQFGDSVLMHLVAIAKEILRPSDIVARFGGEEFVVLLPDICIDEAIFVMNRLRENIAKKCLLQPDNKPFSFTFSAGIAVRKYDELQNSVIQRADEAMYRAKHSGKDKVLSALA